MNNKPTYCPFYKDCLLQGKCPSVLPIQYQNDLAEAIKHIDVFAMKPLCHTDYIQQK